MTPDCAARLSAGMLCAYKSIVSLLLACRSMSCVALTDTPFACSSVANVLRNECQPMCFVIPARTAAGRMTFRKRLSGQYGCCPSMSGLPKRKSASWLYGQRPRQSSRTFARAESNGTAFPLASVFRLPTTWSTMARRGESLPWRSQCLTILTLGVPIRGVPSLPPAAPQSGTPQSIHRVVRRFLQR